MSATSYKKGKGTAGLKGIEFQLDLLTAALVNALRNHKQWKISTENEKAGKYDDIVIELSDGTAVLVQSKHKDTKKISKEQLFSCNTKNVDFSLPKYFFSYEEIKKKFRATVAICTNTAVVTKDLSNSLTTHLATPDNLLYHEGCSFLTFNETIVPELRKSAETYLKNNSQGNSIDKAVITDDNLKDFLENFHFFANYPSSQELRKIIECQLSQLGTFRTSYNDIYRKIEEWFKQPKGEYLTELTATAMLCEIKSDKYCESLKNYEVSFESNFDCADSNLVHVQTEGGCLLHTLRVFHTLQQDKRKQLYVNPDDDVDVQKQTIEAFSQPRYVFLVINCAKNIRGDVAEEIGNQLRETLRSYPYKKVILVGNKLARQLGFEDMSSVDGSITFRDFSKKCKKSLLQRQIIAFQGKTSNLEELLLKDTEEYTQSFNLETLEKLVKGEMMKIGVQVPDLNENKSRYYINRTFQRNINKRGRTEDIFSEENVFSVNEKLLLISDGAGSGKSTVLTKLATVIKEQHPSLWVIRINLNNYSRFLRDWQRTRDRSTDISIVDFLCSQDATRLTQLERIVFSLEEKVVLMLDGVDEVSPDYTELMLDLLVQCQNSANFAKVFVTTRPHTCLELEEVLKVKAFRMLPFTEQNQVRFLTKYWANAIAKDDAYERRCEQYAEALIGKMSTWIKSYDYQGSLAAIPLQVEMLAEIFEQNIKMNGFNGDKTILQLPEKFDITKLYDMFVKKKREVFIDKGNPEGNTLSERAISDQFEKCLMYHRSLALETLLSQTERELFSNCGNGEECMETYLLKIGIAHKNDQGEFQLIHRTFAEYFVARSVLREIEAGNGNVDFCRFLVDGLLLRTEFEVVRAFLDSLLRQTNLPCGIFEKYMSFTYKNNLRLWRSNENLIFVLSREGCVAILQLILKSVNFEDVRGKETNIEIRRRGSLRKNNTLRDLQALLKEGGINIRDDNGCTPLHRAVSARHFEMAEFLVERGANVDIPDEERNTALILAAGESCLDIVMLLVEHGATVTVKNCYGRTALHLAAEYGSLDTVKYLATLVDDLNVEDNDGRTALHLAVQRNYLDTVKHLVGLEVDFGTRDKDGSTVLHLACARGYMEIIKYFMALDIDVNAKDKCGQSALHVASACGYLDVVEYLTKLDIDPNAKDNEGHTALHLAVMNGYLDIVKYLKRNDPQFSIKDNEGRSALHLAVANGFLDVVLEIGGDVNVTDKNGCTALHLAAGKGYIDIARHLVESGADVNMRDGQGRTVLHFAALTNYLSCIKYLAENGADCNAKDNRGCTVLHCAVADGYLDTIRFLVELGVDVNLEDENGRSAFHFAALKARLSTLKYLIDLGVDLNVRDSDGESAIHYAVLNDRMDAVKYLLELGLDPNVKNNYSRTVLHIAALNGKLDTIQYLLKLGVDCEIKDENGNTAFDYIENRDFVEYVVELDLKSSRANSVCGIGPFLETDNLAYMELINDFNYSESSNTNGDRTDHLLYPVELHHATPLDSGQGNDESMTVNSIPHSTDLNTFTEDKLESVEHSFGDSLDKNIVGNGDDSKNLEVPKSVEQSDTSKHESNLEVDKKINLDIGSNGVPNTVTNLIEDNVNIKDGNHISTVSVEGNDESLMVNSVPHSTDLDTSAEDKLDAVKHPFGDSLDKNIADNGNNSKSLEAPKSVEQLDTSEHERILQVNNDINLNLGSNGVQNTTTNLIEDNINIKDGNHISTVSIKSNDESMTVNSVPHTTKLDTSTDDKLDAVKNPFGDSLDKNYVDNGNDSKNLEARKSIEQSNIREHERILDGNNKINMDIESNSVLDTVTNLIEDTINIKDGNHISTVSVEGNDESMTINWVNHSADLNTSAEDKLDTVKHSFGDSLDKNIVGNGDDSKNLEVPKSVEQSDTSKQESILEVDKKINLDIGSNGVPNTLTNLIEDTINIKDGKHMPTVSVEGNNESMTVNSVPHSTNLDTSTEDKLDAVKHPFGDSLDKNIADNGNDSKSLEAPKSVKQLDTSEHERILEVNNDINLNLGSNGVQNTITNLIEDNVNIKDGNHISTVSIKSNDESMTVNSVPHSTKLDTSTEDKLDAVKNPFGDSLDKNYVDTGNDSKNLEARKSIEQSNIWKHECILDGNNKINMDIGSNSVLDTVTNLIEDTINIKDGNHISTVSVEGNDESLMVNSVPHSTYLVTSAEDKLDAVKHPFGDSLDKNITDNGDNSKNLESPKSVEESDTSEHERTLEVNNKINLDIVSNGITNTVDNLMEDNININGGNHIVTVSVEEHNTNGNSAQHLPINHDLDDAKEPNQNNSEATKVHKPRKPDTGQNICQLCAVI